MQSVGIMAGLTTESRRLRNLTGQLSPAPVADEPKFVSLQEGAKMTEGLRVTMIPGLPGLFPEAFKNFLDARGTPYTRVMHPMASKADPNQTDLFALTKQKSTPVFFFNDERPRSAWIEQVKLGDQLGTKGESLIPADPEERVLMFGLLSELLSEDGIMWRGRLLGGKSAFTLKYGWSEKAADAGPARMAESVKLFADQLNKQKAAGSKFIIGNKLTALDPIFATCSYMLKAPGPDIVPVTKTTAGFLKGMGRNPKPVQDVVEANPYIIEYRDHILKTYCITPAVL